MSRRILNSREAALAVVRAYGADVLTGQAPGISLADMIECAIDDACSSLKTTKVKAFIRAFDRWSGSGELCGGDRFDAMLDAREALE